jgi:hypothetical protein
MNATEVNGGADMTVHELIALLGAMPQDATVVAGDAYDGGLGKLRHEEVRQVQLGGIERAGVWLLEPYREGLEGPYLGVHIG